MNHQTLDVNDTTPGTLDRQANGIDGHTDDTRSTWPQCLPRVEPETAVLYCQHCNDEQLVVFDYDSQSHKCLRCDNRL